MVAVEDKSFQAIPASIKNKQKKLFSYYKTVKPAFFIK